MNKLAKAKIRKSDELPLAYKELLFQLEEKEKRAAELGIANTELNKAGNVIRKLNVGLEQKIKERTHELQKSLKEVSDYKYAINQSSTVEIVNSEGKITFANENFCKISKYSKEELTGQEHRIMMSGYHPKSFYTELWNTIISGKIWKGEIKNKAKDGSLYWVDTVIIPFLGASGKPWQYMVFREDITHRKQAEEALVESIQFNKQIIRNAQDGIVVYDRDLRYQVWNPFIEKFSGLPADKVLGRLASEVFPFLEESGVIESMKKALKGEIVTTPDFYFTIPDSEISGWAHDTNAPLMNSKGEIIGIIGTVRDITARKQAESALKKSEEMIRNYAQHLNRVLEEERTHIAYEIHDEIGQLLAGIKLGLASFKKFSTEDNKMESRIIGMMQDVDNSMQKFREIATQLRPGILDTLGLVPSIKWLGEEFEKKTGIKCRIEIKPEAPPQSSPLGRENVKSKVLPNGEDLGGAFDKQLSTCFFRICQESLTNISKHAGASEVVIEIKQQTTPQPSPMGREKNVSSPSGGGQEGALVLRISDNGKGIASEKLENPFSMGLLGMRERANAIGATLLIESKINAGTSITLNAPIPYNTKSKQLSDDLKILAA